MNSLNYTPKASSDDVSLDSATTSADKTEKLSLQTPQHRHSSGAKRTPRRSAIPALRRPVLASSPPSASCHIRHRYLSKLGVAEASPPSPSPKPSPFTTQQKISPVGVLKTGNTKSNGIKSNVTFQKQVSVQYIPDKRQLHNREDLWVQKEEFTELFQRNCLEYAADGWNWENATEESEFVHFQNELVHPAHFRGQTCNMQRQFLMNMYAQRQSGYY